LQRFYPKVLIVGKTNPKYDMATAMKAKVKYSTGASEIGSAKDFPWEYGVPDNDFWNDLDWKIGKNFLTCFTDAEIDAMTPQLKGTLSRTEKIKLLRCLLQDTLAFEERNLAPKSLLEVDVKRWKVLMFAIGDTYRIDGNPTEERKNLEEIIAKSKPASKLAHNHHLASLMVDTGQYAEAVKTEIPVLTLLDEKLGVDSPQSLGGRRIIASALWKLGKKEEAENMIEQVWKNIELSAYGQFAAYQEEEKRITQELMSELQAWDEKVKEST